MSHNDPCDNYDGAFDEPKRIEHPPWPEIGYTNRQRAIAFMRERAAQLHELPGRQNKIDARTLAAAATMLEDWT